MSAARRNILMAANIDMEYDRRHSTLSDSSLGNMGVLSGIKSVVGDLSKVESVEGDISGAESVVRDLSVVAVLAVIL